MIPALLLTALIWGGSYPGVKVVQAAIPPVALAAFRCSVAALVLLGVTGLTGARGPRLDRSEWGRVVLLGLAGNTVFQLCLIGGLRYTSPAHSALIVSLSPLVTALLARVWLHEPLRPVRVLGILISLAGVVLLVRKDGAGATPSALVGDLVSLGAAAGWAVYSVASKPMLARRPALQVATLAMIVGAVPLLGLGLPGLRTVAWTELSAGTWALLAYLSVVALALNYILFYWALARAAVARVAVFQFVTPVAAVLLSVALGQQALTPTLVASGLAVLGGVALAQRG